MEEAKEEHRRMTGYQERAKGEQENTEADAEDDVDYDELLQAEYDSKKPLLVEVQ